MGIKGRAAVLSIASNTALTVMKLVVGFATGSVAVISEAAHSAIDLMASLITYFSVSAADVPADEEHPYGHGKIENISGVIEALLIFAAGAYIVYEVVKRLPDALKGEVEVQPTLGIAVMLISAVANYSISSWLFRVAKETDSIALEADGHHLRTDVWTSAGVLTGLLLLKITGWAPLDSIVALLVAGLIMKVAIDLTRQTGASLIDARLPVHEIERVIEILKNESEIIDFHKLRTRKAGSERQIDVHIIVPATMNVREAHRVAENLENRIQAALGGALVVTHIEPDSDESSTDSE